jgi:hypothetical protein
MYILVVVTGFLSSNYISVISPYREIARSIYSASIKIISSTRDTVVEDISHVIDYPRYFIETANKYRQDITETCYNL